MQGEAQEGANQHHGGQGDHALAAVEHDHRLDQVAGDQEVEPQQDGAADTVAVLQVGVAAFVEVAVLQEAPCGHGEADDDDHHAQGLDDQGDGVDQLQEPVHSLRSMNAEESAPEVGGAGGSEPGQADGDHRPGDEQLDQAEAHDVLGLEAGDGEHRQGPEGLQQVGPGVAPGHRHGHPGDIHAQRLGGGQHDRRLHGPLAAAGGHEEVDDAGADEGPEGQRGLGGEGDQRLGHAGGQARLHHDRHDPGVEGELDDDAGTALDRLVEADQQAARGAVQHDGQEQEQEVDDVQVQAAAAQQEVIEQEDQPRDAHQPGQGHAVLEAIGRATDACLGLGSRFLQQLGIDVDALLVVGEHQAVDQRDDDEEADHDGQVEEGEDGGAGADHADLVGAEVAIGGDGQRDGAGQAAVPHHEAGVGAGHQQAVVHPDQARQLLGEQRPHHQAEAPVDPAGRQRHIGDQQDGAAGALGQGRQALQQLLYRGGAGQHEAGDQYQQHLHGEGQQAQKPSPHIRITASGVWRSTAMAATAAITVSSSTKI